MKEFIANIFKGVTPIGFIVIVVVVMVIVIIVTVLILGPKLRRAQEQAHQEYLERQGQSNYENREMRRFKQYKSKHK